MGDQKITYPRKENTLKSLHRFSIFSVCFFALLLASAKGYSHTITASVTGVGGAITPSSTVTVPDGGTQTFTIGPVSELKDVYVDGISMGPITSYTFSSVTADHSIIATFGCSMNLPVKLENDGSTYSSVMAAYTSALQSGFTTLTIDIMAGTLPQENLYFNSDVTVTLNGGFDCSFSTPPTMTSSIPGSMTIAAGLVIPSNLGASSPLACQPGDPNNFPGNAEICDGQDNNCNGQIDEGLSVDADNDGHTAIGSCTGTADDCNDNDPTVYPGATEICDFKDNNCNGQIDEGFTAVDSDGDGYAAIDSCGVGNKTDCNDNDPSINPGATEIWGDGIDQNCDGREITSADMTACISCHGVNVIVGNHANDPTATPPIVNVHTPDSTCVSCHPWVATSLLDGHYGKTVGPNNDGLTVGSKIECNSCHDESSTAVVWPRVALALGGVGVGNETCDTCHLNRVAAHDTITAHANRVIDSGCAQCHTSDTAVLGQPGSGTLTSQANVDTLHRSDCTLCHDYTTPSTVNSPDPATVAQAIENGMNGTQITCTTCHTVPHHSGFGVHFDPTVDTSQPTVTPCADCHHVYDDKNGTTVGLSTFTAILWQHDVLDGVIDGVGACQACHSYAGGKSENPTTVANAISSGLPATCATCHTDKVPNVSHGGHTATTFVWDGDCNTCHTDGGLGIEAGVHNGKCTLCHNNPNGGKGTTIVGVNGDGDATLGAALADFKTAGCLTCHPSATYPKPWIHHDTAPATSGNCVNCHNTTNGHAGNHTTMVSLSANCSLCHTGTEGGVNNVPVDPANNKVHDACTSCHTINTTTKNVVLIDPATSPLVGAMPDGGTTGGTDGGGACEACHGAYFPNHQNIDHTTSRVTVNANCANCHDTTPGGTAPDAITSPFTGSGEAHAVKGCSTCHQADGSLVAPTTIAPGITTGGGDCVTCHGAYFPNHQSVNHSTYVAPATDCVTCHTATAGTATGVPVSTTDNKVHDACSSCHNTTTGSLLTVTAPGGSAPIAQGDCTGCHGVYFSKHTHHFSTPPNDLTFDPTVDTSQPTATPCNSCHHIYDDRNGTSVGLSTFTAILWQHDLLDGTVDGIGACQACHSYAGGSSENPTTVATAISSGLPGTCATCHTDKVPNVSHGGHTAATFGWDGNCNTCHTDGGLGIVAGVHKNTCTLCHDNPAGGKGTTIVGLNGDGDATLGAALADFQTATCLTCHPSAAYPEPWIHHDTPPATSGNCVNCHNTTNGNAGNHTTMVNLSTNCSLCHAGTEGGVDNVPVDPANNKVHDACTSCHTIDATTKNVVLIDPVTSPLVIAMPDGGTVGGTDGGGTCEACHGAYFSSHTNIDHMTSRVTVNANCANCHDTTPGGTAPDAITPPFTGSGEVHAASGCSTCHQADGSLVAPTTIAPGITTGGGDCVTCHGAYFPNHQNVDHTVRVADTANCNTCHTGTAGTITGVPVSLADNEVHDSCASCHNTTNGALLTITAPGGSAPIAPGDCNGCHGFYFPNHTNANHTANVADTANCNSCHTGTAGTATGVPVSLADNKVHDSCASCHNTTNGALLTITAPGGTTPIAPGDCNGCHGAYFTNHTNADHTANVAGTATCITCHTATAGTATGMPVSLTDNKVHDACSSCHNTTSGSLLAVTAPGGATLIAPGECIGCHGNYFTNHTHHFSTPPNDLTFDPAVDTSQPTVQPCSDCHHVYDDKNGTSVGLTTFIAILWQHDVLDGVVDGVGACQACHSYAGGKSEDPTTVATAISSGLPATCATCHTDKVPNVSHGGHDATTFVWDGTCNTCHTDNGLGIVAGVHKSQCTLCHDNPNGGKGTTIVGVNGDGNAQLAAALADFKTAGCTTCHDPSIYPTGRIHHDTPTAANNDCTTCHASVDHTAMIVAESPCLDCHNQTAGTMTGAPVSLTDPMIHDSCVTCHTVDANKDMVLRNFTNQKGVNGTGSLPDGGTVGGTDGGGTCTVCHTGVAASPADFHHAITNGGSGYAAVGDCEYCHADPRPNWGIVTGPGDNGTASGVDRPTQMACAECHVSFNGTTMTVTKFTRSNYTSYATDWTRTTVHSIANTAGRINNYGICFSCHNNANNATAPQVGVWHARPDRFGGQAWIFYPSNTANSTQGKTQSRSSCDTRTTGDQAHYAPGRSKDQSSGVSPQSLIGGFNLWAPNYGLRNHIGSRSYRCDAQNEDKNQYNAPAYDTPAFSLIALPTVASNTGHSSQPDLQVPVFASLAPNQGTPSPAADNVQVISAIWNGTSLTVNATNSIGCGVLTVQYGTASQVMSGSATCAATLSGVTYPTDGTTVNVVTSDTDGISVYGYRINGTP